MMWYCSYRHHAIMAFPSFDTTTNSWAPQANISWVVGPARESKFIRFPMRVSSESEAVDCALKAARVWIDEHKKIGIDPRWNTENEPFTPVQEHRLIKRDATHTRRLHSTFSKNSARAFTFDDFKANLADLGARTSEQLLLKSYGALVQLRNNRHCSWAQLLSRLKRSRENRADLRSAQRGTKTASLPLTVRDWRRMM